MNGGKWLAAFFVAAGVAWAQPFSAGIVAGVPLTDGLSNVTQSEVDLVEKTFSNSKLYIIGAIVEVRLPLGIAIEADGLYRPVNSAMNLQVIPGPVFHYSENVATWEFPILAKYRFSLLPIVKPFVEAGPSFRTKGSGLSWLSDRGITAGVGVEIKVIKLRISPEIRYTHWGSDAAPTSQSGFLPPSNQDQAEFLVGFSF
jgi:hypothetical protein